MKWQTTRKMRMVPLAMAGLLVAGPTLPADKPSPQREKKLSQRQSHSEAQAAALQLRIEELETRVAALRKALAEAPPPAKISTAALRPGAVIAQASPPSAPPRATGGSAGPARPAPGAFEVDEEAAQRALERTLTQSGALLLPARTIEVTPSYSFTRNETTVSVPTTVTTASAPTPTLVLANQRTRRSENTARVDIRAGMPYNSQLELSLPYNYVRSSQINDLGGDTSSNGSSVGDIRLGVAKSLTRESGWKPDLIGRLSYNFGNGDRRDGDVPMPGGYRQIQAELVAIKRQDPLAFVASTFYGKAFEEDGVKPGDLAGFSLSAVLAASPATSLQFGFSQIHRQKQEFNGAKVAGSDQTYGIVNLGASSVLSRDVTLVTQFGIGVGSDAPKYSFTISLPILIR